MKKTFFQTVKLYKIMKSVMIFATSNLINCTDLDIPSEIRTVVFRFECNKICEMELEKYFYENSFLQKFFKCPSDIRKLIMLIILYVHMKNLW